MSNYNQISPNKFGSIPLMNSAIQMTNSSFIKSEIERFESVHPSIYSIYELLDEIKDQSHTQTQIRDHVMVIEGIRSPHSFLPNRIEGEQRLFSVAQIHSSTVKNGQSAVVFWIFASAYSARFPAANPRWSIGFSPAPTCKKNHLKVDGSKKRSISTIKVICYSYAMKPMRPMLK